jgi:hypothetical protein
MGYSLFDKHSITTAIFKLVKFTKKSHQSVPIQIDGL